MTDYLDTWTTEDGQWWSFQNLLGYFLYSKLKALFLMQICSLKE